MNSITKLLLLTLLSFSQNYYFQIQKGPSIYEEYDLYVYENGKDLQYDIKDNDIFDKKDRKNVHFKKPDITIDLSAFSKAQTNILNALKVAEENLRILKDKKIIDRLALGVKDTNVYLGGLKESDIGKYSEKISLDLVKDNSGYGFKININFHIIKITINYKTSTHSRRENPRLFFISFKNIKITISKIISIFRSKNITS